MTCSISKSCLLAMTYKRHCHRHFVPCRLVDCSLKYNPLCPSLLPASSSSSNCCGQSRGELGSCLNQMSSYGMYFSSGDICILVSSVPFCHGSSLVHMNCMEKMQKGETAQGHFVWFKPRGSHLAFDHPVIKLVLHIWSMRVRISIMLV